MSDERKIARLRPLAAISAILCPALSACQTFVKTDVTHAKPVFSWSGGVPAAGLTVGPVLESCKFEGPHSEERIWWQITGEIASPITYGETPKGATVRVPPRRLTTDCGEWVVTVTDQNMRGESAIFRLKPIRGK